MKSIYRFYKNNKQSIDSLAESYIYLFSAKMWENDSEFDFDIDIGSDVDYKRFLESKLLAGFKLNLGDEGFEAFKQNRINKLTKYNKKELLNSEHEYAFLLEKLFEEAMSETGILERRELIKDGFFNATGISCFTSDGMAVENLLHWDTFANAGNGFCVEYNLERLHEYFVNNDLGISWGQISYYGENRPRLRLPQTDLEEARGDYFKVFFSLKQQLKDEKELRFARLFYEPVEKDDNRRKLVIPRDSIVSVTLGDKIPIDDEEVIMNLIRENLSHIVTYKMKEQFDFIYRYKLE